MSKLIAHFQPQAWQHDYAIEVDDEGPDTWDATPFAESVMGLTNEINETCDADGYWLDVNDQFIADPSAPQWAREWRGPFTITVTTED